MNRNTHRFCGELNSLIKNGEIMNEKVLGYFVTGSDEFRMRVAWLNYNGYFKDANESKPKELGEFYPVCEICRINYQEEIHDGALVVTQTTKGLQFPYCSICDDQS